MDQTGSTGPCTGVILAGGRSSRLGQDKAFLDVNGQYLIERVIERLAHVADQVVIAADDIERYANLEARVIGDVYPGKAALGGIYSGLKAARGHHSVVVACDMPFLNVSLLRHMQGLAAGYDVVIPRIGRLTEALHAIYSRECLPFMEQQLRAGDLRIVHFFPNVRVRYVDQDEMKVFDPDLLSFFNINNQADLDIAREIWSHENPGQSTKVSEHNATG
jgi:molybdopterin-guanine dinucleotide biosynthesis protein A